MHTESPLFHWRKTSPGRSSPRLARARLCALTAALLLPSCAYRSYEPESFEAQSIVERLVAERRALSSAVAQADGAEPVLDLDAAALLLRERNPAFLAALAAYETAHAKAQIATARPNPELALGSTAGIGADAESPQIVPALEFELILPTAGKLARMDDLNAARAEEARVHALSEYREQYLELRRRYATLAVAQARASVGSQIVEAAARSLAATELLVEAGSGQALDVSLFTLEFARERAHAMDVNAGVDEARSGLASLLALDAAGLLPLPANALPQTLGETPSLATLQARLAAEQPQLQRLQAAYAVSELALRLEFARQYPDLSLKGELGGDVGEKITLLGLALGMALPLFDRNEQAISEAWLRRTEARARFMSATHTALSELERAQRAVAMATALREMLQGDVLPAAQTHVVVARRSLTAGIAGGLQVIDAERSLREVELEVLEAQFAELMAWCDMEQAVGAPLLDFGTAQDSMPPAPDTILMQQEDER